jgi:Rhodopirellula transposase DDE domain
MSAGGRVFAGGEVRPVGCGSLEAVSAITWLARSTICRGLKDLGRRAAAEGPGAPQGWRPAAPVEPARDADRGAAQRHRAGHAGRSHAPAVVGVERPRRGGGRVAEQGCEISASSVKRLLPTLGYSRQSNRKADEGSKHPDRNAQFEHINAKAIAEQVAGQPVISVDTKKKSRSATTRTVAPTIARKAIRGA